MRLSGETLGLLPQDINRFSYDRDAQEFGIVHLGIGAFHRAHQAVYTDDAMNAGDRDWAICGVSLRSAAVKKQLVPQDGLYSVTERQGSGDNVRIVGAVRSVLVGTEQEAGIIDAIASAGTRIVSLTVTEKGYHNAGIGGLAMDAPDIAHDLSAASGKRTIYGLLATGLAKRRAAARPGVTLLSCDNLASNGARLSRNLSQYLDVADPSLRRWFEAECASPATMVDRIVPATTAQQLDALEACLGCRDEAAVWTEPFSQWVIEDNFAGRRPRWELAGAQFVRDVKLYEDAKLRMLNGAHSALAYIGLRAGHAYVHEAIANQRIRPLIVRLMLDEAAPTLPPSLGFDPQAYAAQLLERFSNPALAHRLAQIAMDGSQKIPQRWFPTLRCHQRNGRQCPAILTALAAWLVHLRSGSGEVTDPMVEVLEKTWRKAGANSVAAAFFGPAGLLAHGWAATPKDIEFLDLQMAAYSE